MDVVLVLVGGGLTLFGQWAAAEWARKHKAEERYESQLDKHRDEVLRAIAEFLGSCVAWLQRAVDYEVMEKLMDSAVDKGFADRKLADRVAATQDEYFAARGAAQVHAYKLLLLIKDEVVAEEVRAIAIESMPDDMDQFGEVVKSRRDRLRALTRKLEGLFVPEPPPSEGGDGAPRRLDVVPPGKLLP